MKEKAVRCVKMIGNKNFVLELIESNSGRYYIVYEREEGKKFSEPFTDLKLALDLFDIKLQELEGH